MFKKFDVYEMVTNRIIDQLEKGIIPWHKPWQASLGYFVKNTIDLRKVAFNRITKKAYSFLNQMLLSKSGEYASFAQWHNLGGSIKKGAKAETVVFWKIEEIKITDKTEEDSEEEQKEKIVKLPILKYYQVFHIDDVTGVKPLELEDVEAPEEETENFDKEEQAEEVISNYSQREKVKIIFGGDSAFYSPSKDYIQVPHSKQFQEKAEYYSTLFHEIIHSTGAKNRLDRLEPSSRFGNEGYSKEELVAEIGASGILSLLNIETSSSFKNSVAYIQSWIQVLRNDKKMIVSASSKAEKAIEFIFKGKE